MFQRLALVVYCLPINLCNLVRPGTNELMERIKDNFFYSFELHSKNYIHVKIIKFQDFTVDDFLIKLAKLLFPAGLSKEQPIFETEKKFALLLIASICHLEIQILKSLKLFFQPESSYFLFYLFFINF